MNLSSIPAIDAQTPIQTLLLIIAATVLIAIISSSDKLATAYLLLTKKQKPKKLSDGAVPKKEEIAIDKRVVLVERIGLLLVFATCVGGLIAVVPLFDSAPDIVGKSLVVMFYISLTTAVGVFALARLFSRR